MSTIDLLALPFDHYQRYSAVAQVAETARAHLDAGRLDLLDVGGFYRTRWAEEILPLVHFLPTDRIVAADLIPCHLPGYVMAPGQRLPFADQAFDLVVSCDTLEHVPQARRPEFVEELLRVARHIVILIAPFDHSATRLAERTLADYLASQGTHHTQLQEHLDNGLPSAEWLRAWLSDKELSSFDIADGYLHRWLWMMLIKHTPGLSLDFQLDLDRYYNLHYSALDRREPAYRRIFVIAQPASQALLPQAAATLQNEANLAPPDHDQWSAELLQAINSGQAAMLAHALQCTQGQLAEAQHQLASAQGEIARLQELVHGYEQGRVMRLMTGVQRFLGLRGR